MAENPKIGGDISPASLVFWMYDNPTLKFHSQIPNEVGTAFGILIGTAFANDGILIIDNFAIIFLYCIFSVAQYYKGGDESVSDVPCGGLPFEDKVQVHNCRTAFF